MQNAFERVFAPATPNSQSEQQSEQASEAKPEPASLSYPQPINGKEEQKEVFKSVLEKIASYKTAQRSNRTQAFSRRLVLGAHHDIQAAVCASTGIVYALLMPAIGGKAMLVDSPFSSYKNVRGMVQQGADYLRRLDAQILSGLLIIMAEYNGELFRYQPADTAAQKNALLRTIDREILIDALILIENYINSNNSFYIPKLSLILDTQTLQEGLNARMKEWLKTVVEAIYKPDTQEYEEACAVHKSPMPAFMAPASKLRKEAIAVKKEFRDWKKDAKEDINTLFTDKKISFKMKSFLLSILTEDNIAAASSEAIALLCTKLNQLESTDASELADQISYFHSKLATPASEDWDAPVEKTFASQPVGSSLSPTVAEGQEQPILSSSSTEATAGTEANAGVPSLSAMPKLEKPMSFAERVKMRKMAKQTSDEQQGKEEQEIPNDF